MDTKTSLFKFRCGFTLIELLVVVSIIALLVSILLPALSKARKQTQAIVCAVNERGIGTALYLYALDYNGYFPTNPLHDLTRVPAGSWYRDVHCLSGYNGGWTGLGLLWSTNGGKPVVGQYLDKSSHFYCPQNKSYNLQLTNPTFFYQMWHTNEIVLGTYDYLGHFSFSGAARSYRSRISDPSGKLVVSETRYSTFYQNRYHGNKMNVLYLGGHVVSFNVDALGGDAGLGLGHLMRMVDDPFTEPHE